MVSRKSRSVKRNHAAHRQRHSLCLHMVGRSPPYALAASCCDVGSDSLDNSLAVSTKSKDHIISHGRSCNKVVSGFKNPSRPFVRVLHPFLVILLGPALAGRLFPFNLYPTPVRFRRCTSCHSIFVHLCGYCTWEIWSWIA